MMIFSIFCSVFVYYTCISNAVKGKYNYLEPMEWNYKFSSTNKTGFCNGEKQSPIDVKRATLTQCTGKDIKLKIVPHQKWRVGNNGVAHEAYPLGLLPDKESIMRLTNNWSPNPGFDQEYCFDQMHFHWGLNSRMEGSEHSIDGKFSALEVHFVHHSCDYASLAEALTQAETNPNIRDRYVLAVIGVMFEIGPTDNPAINQLFLNGNAALLDQIQFPPSQLSGVTGQATINEFNISALLPDKFDYYYYEGSLTTPDCGEFVRWHLMQDKLTVSEKQMGWFRQLYGNRITTLSNNVRPPQRNSFPPQSCTGTTNTKQNSITWLPKAIVKNNLTNYPEIDVDGVLKDIYGDVDYDGNKAAAAPASEIGSLVPFIIIIVILVIVIIAVIVWNLKLRKCLGGETKKSSSSSKRHDERRGRSSAVKHHSSGKTRSSRGGDKHSTRSSRGGDRSSRKYNSVSSDDRHNNMDV